ncbi:unnamed protein product, partial [Staurois parvus]
MKVIIGSSCSSSGYREMGNPPSSTPANLSIDGGEFAAHAEAGSSLGAKTTRRNPYELTESILMVDNRGMPTLDRFQTGEIFAQLGNLLPLNQEVEWVEDYNKNVDRVM